jgi:RND family efflux transporter MFP subunit
MQNTSDQAPAVLSQSREVRSYQVFPERIMSGPSSRCFYLLLLPAALVVGCRPPEEQPAAVPPKVTIDHPTMRELVDEAEFNGWLEGSSEVEVRSRVRGHIQKVHFQDGDIVQQGQLLFELDPRPFSVQVDLATAQARARDAQRIAAEKDAARHQVLVRSGAVSQQDLEKIVADAESYGAQVVAMEQEVKLYELDLEYSRITAPIGGRIGRAMLTEGNLVNAGGSDPLLTTIVAVDPLHVYFAVDERTLQRYMQANREEESEAPGGLRSRNVAFRFALDSDIGFPHEGTLDFADNRVDPETGTVQVRGVVENKQGRLVPGSRVRVRVPQTKPYTAVVVPDTAILSDQDKRYLLVVDDDNTVKRRDVTPGRLLDDGMRVILPGEHEGQQVTPDDRIIVLGLQRARLNYPVDPVEDSE